MLKMPPVPPAFCGTVAIEELPQASAAHLFSHFDSAALCRKCARSDRAVIA